MQLLRMNPAQQCRGSGFQPSCDPIPQSNRRRVIRGVNMVMRCQSYILACNYPNAAPRGENAEMGSIEIDPPHPLHFSTHPAPVSPNRLATGLRQYQHQGRREMPPIEGKFGPHPGRGSSAVLLRIVPDLANYREECCRWVPSDLGSRRINARQVRLLGEYGCPWSK